MFEYSRKKIILSIGDDGAVLSYFKRGRLQKRLFASSPNSVEAEDLKDLCREQKNAVLYILVDILDQSYVQHQFPPVSSLTVNNLVRRKLEKDYAPGDIKAAIKMGRAASGRKDWNFLFVSIHNVPPFSEWVELALDLPNVFGGIYMLPIEVEPMLHSLDKAMEGQKGEKSSKWKILITHNRVGGVRQMIFKNRKMILTRMSQPVGNSTPDIIAGNIEQDLSNTVEFIRRIGFDESEGFDVFVVAADEVKRNMEISKINANAVFLLTPNELANRLHLPNAAEENDRFADVAIAASFANRNKHILKVNTPYSKKLENLFILGWGQKIVSAAFILVAVILGVYSVISIMSLQKQIALLQQNKRASTQSLEAVKEESQAFPVQIGKMLDDLYFYRLLNQNNKFALNFTSRLSEIKPDTVLIRSFNINIEDKLDNKTQPVSLKASFGADILNPEKKIELVIDAANNFTSVLNSALPEYEIKYGNLPGSGKGDISATGGANDIVNFTFEIKGPVEKKPVNPVPPVASPAAPSKPGDAK